MEIYLTLSGFILACLVALLYEYKIRLLRKQRNNVHFYVARDKNGTLYLYIGKPIRDNTKFLCNKGQSLFYTGTTLSAFGLNDKDYANLKWEDEPVEVFLNLED